MLPSLVHVLNCMRCSEWKRGLKRRCILFRSDEAFFLVTFEPHVVKSSDIPSEAHFCLFLCVIVESLCLWGLP